MFKKKRKLPSWCPVRRGDPQDIGWLMREIESTGSSCLLEESREEACPGREALYFREKVCWHNIQSNHI